MGSAGNAIELAKVARRDPVVFENAMAFLNQPFLPVGPVDAQRVALAQDTYPRFGIGRRAAKLNIGDTFAKARAHDRNFSLRFQGNDCARTEIACIVNEAHCRSRRDREADDEPSLLQQRSVSQRALPGPGRKRFPPASRSALAGASCLPYYARCYTLKGPGPPGGGTTLKARLRRSGA